MLGLLIRCIYTTTHISYLHIEWLLKDPRQTSPDLAIKLQNSMTPLKKQRERVLSMATYFARPSPPPLKRENILLRLAGFVLEQPKYSVHAAFLIGSIKG